MSTRLYFIRHGESEANLGRVFAGHYDVPLTERGRQQAEATAEFLSNVPITAVYASDLSRAFETGRTVAERLQVPLHSTENLREIAAGEWEAQPFSALEAQPAYQVWLETIGLAHPPNGESVAQLQQRIRRAVEDIVSRHPCQAICIATHATSIRVMECLWRDIPLEEMHTVPWVKNASVTVAEYDASGQGHLLERDVHEHLKELTTVLPANV